MEDGEIKKNRRALCDYVQRFSPINHLNENKTVFPYPTVFSGVGFIILQNLVCGRIPGSVTREDY